MVVLATSSLAARALSRSTCASSAAIPCAARCALAAYSGTRESSASASASAPATSAVAHARQVHRGPRVRRNWTVNPKRTLRGCSSPCACYEGVRTVRSVGRQRGAQRALRGGQRGHTRRMRLDCGAQRVHRAQRHRLELRGLCCRHARVAPSPGAATERGGACAGEPPLSQATPQRRRWRAPTWRACRVACRSVWIRPED